MAENQNKETVKYFKNGSVEFLNELKKELIRLNKRATGNLINSFSYEVRDFITNIKIDYYYEFYGRYVESGRKPGKFPPIQAIRNWARVKGIDESLAYPIARKIYKFGIKPTPFVSDVLESQRFEDKIAAGVEQKASQDLEIEIIKLVEDFNQQQKNN